MSINPYQPPTLDALRADELLSSEMPMRPIGISILAVLHGLGSLLLAGLLIFLFFADAEGNARFSAQKGFPLILFFLLFSIAISLGLASAVGMWIGASWGWWLATWYWFFMAVGNGVSLPISLARLNSIGGDAAVIAVTR